MLILTTNALAPGVGDILLPEWPGLQVLVVLPGAGLDRRAMDGLNDRFILLEWLEEPTSAALVLRDVVGWLGPRLRQEDGPLLYLDRPFDVAAEAFDPAQVPLHAVDAEHAADGRLLRLVLGEMVAASPLLAGFFRMLEGRLCEGQAIDDALMVDLLADTLAWGTA